MGAAASSGYIGGVEHAGFVHTLGRLGVVFVQTGHAAVVTRFGRVTRVLAPGVSFYVPFVHRVTGVRLASEVLKFQMDAFSGTQQPLLREVRARDDIGHVLHDLPALTAAAAAHVAGPLAAAGVEVEAVLIDEVVVPEAGKTALAGGGAPPRGRGARATRATCAPTRRCTSACRWPRPRRPRTRSVRAAWPRRAPRSRAACTTRCARSRARACPPSS